MDVEYSTQLAGISDADIEASFAPFVVERRAPDDPWLADEERRLDEKYSRPLKKAVWRTDEGRRTTDTVKSGYEAAWGRVSLASELDDPKVIPFEWRGRGMLARAVGRKHLHQLYLVRALQWLRPGSVLEVGFGDGLNLLLLSMQFPDVRFSGVELTQAGLDAALALARDPATPATLAPFAVGPLLDPGAPARLALQTGSAAQLPLGDGSVDLAMTVLALEQMERIRGHAIRELARVARRHVVMIEPFRDCNADGHRRKYIERNDYFAAWVRDLPEYGLTPIVATADMPNKLSFRAGVVIAEKQP